MFSIKKFLVSAAVVSTVVVVGAISARDDGMTDYKYMYFDSATSKVIVGEQLFQCDGSVKTTGRITSHKKYMNFNCIDDHLDPTPR